MKNKRKLIAVVFLAAMLLNLMAVLSSAANNNGELTAKVIVKDGEYYLVVTYESGNNSVKSGIFEVLAENGEAILLKSPEVIFGKKIGEYVFALEIDIPERAVLRMTEAKKSNPVVVMGVFDEGFVIPGNFSSIKPKYLTALDYLSGNIDEILYHVCMADKNFDYIKNSLQTATITTGFKTLNLDTIDEIFSEITYFPIMNDDVGVAMIAVSCYKGEYSCTVGEFFSDKLNSMRDTDCIIFSTENDFYVLEENGMPTSGSNLSVDARSRLFQLELDKVDDVLDRNEYNIKKYFQTMESIFECKDYVESENIVMRASGNLSNFPAIGQGVYGICWAASIAAISNYTQNTKYNAQTLIDGYQPISLKNLHILGIVSNTDFGIQYGNTWYYKTPTAYSVRVNIFPSYFPGALPYLNGVTSSTITNAINSSKPVYIQAETIGQTNLDLDDASFHAVVIYGYNDNGTTYSVSIMDSLANSKNGGYILNISNKTSNGNLWYTTPTGYNMEFRRALVK